MRCAHRGMRRVIALLLNQNRYQVLESTKAVVLHLVEAKVSHFNRGRGRGLGLGLTGEGFLTGSVCSTSCWNCFDVLSGKYICAISLANFIVFTPYLSLRLSNYHGRRYCSAGTTYGKAGDMRDCTRSEPRGSALIDAYATNSHVSVKF